MQVVGAIVDCQGIFPAIQGKPASSNAVGKAAHDRPQIAVLVLILLESLVPQDHVHRPSGPVRYPEGT